MLTENAEVKLGKNGIELVANVRKAWDEVGWEDEMKLVESK